MSLRLRLTLLVMVVTTAGFLGSGILLRWGLEASLLHRLDSQLGRATEIALTLLGPDPEDGSSRFVPERGLPVLPQLLPGLVLLLVNEDGALLDAFGRPPNPSLLQELAQGKSSIYRIHTRPLADGLLLRAALPLEPVQESLRFLTRLLLWIIPLVFLGTLAGAYFLLGRGLNPLDRLTRRAMTLAEQRRWGSSLPEPRSRDEVWRFVRAVNSLLFALGEVIQSERRFTQDAAHALRTPLSILSGRLERALAQAPASVKPELLEAQKSLRDMLDLVESLLHLARADAGSLEKRPVFLDTLAFEESERMREAFNRLDWFLPEEPVVVSGDETALRAAIRALLENALHHGGGQASLRVYPQGRQAYLEVHDQGPGLEPGQIPHIFQRFYRGRRSAGSGLGLALVDAVVRWHGGQVIAGRSPEGGALLGFALPLQTKS
ncbi:sensor histidine kinase [Meiothermus taiwanensis]|jgi:two-component system OmpR family sensor kinase|uniref:histidine kinase n=1 Tax=Meiothermus taiwanensis TaxID=172827 RepID=A0A399DS54_9DEIN|nr:HAMP domain-containing sensor histidine kinase [Meiothermus taiwanensis]KIQ54349.1 histidine kinase [Meiothermus taiwanensis]KZK14711.1 histidine kinase [Meiothermus taiwanensis]RIH75065.1 Signal transduction histidine-protein kinase BaeS [Meiothermus taiwanensis]